MPNTNLTVGDKDPEETNFLTPVILDRRRRLQFSSVQFSPVQSLSRVRLFATPWTAA